MMAALASGLCHFLQTLEKEGLVEPSSFDANGAEKDWRRSPAISRPIREGRSLRPGFSLIEVMISLALMATGLMTVIGTVYSLNMSKRATNEEAIAQNIAQIMSERLMGSKWDDLGKDDATNYPADRHAWSWHRRATPRPTYPAPVNPPLQEGTGDITTDLQMQKLVTGKTGMKNLKVYLEYYQFNLLQLFNNELATATNPRLTWLQVCGDPIKKAPPSNATINAAGSAVWLDESNSKGVPAWQNNATTSLIMRILVVWDSCIGGTRCHELVITRRQ